MIPLSILFSKKEADVTEISYIHSIWLRGKDLNQRPPGYEPDELPTALPRDIDLFVEKPFGAGNRAWTGTRGESHGILSPGRLPIPPFRRSHLLFDSIPYKRAFVNTEFQFFEAFRWIFLNHIALPFSHSPVIIAAHGKHYCRIHEKDTRQYSVFPYCTASVIVSVLWIMATDHRHAELP